MSEKPTIVLRKGYYKSFRIIEIIFPYNQDIIKAVRKVEGATWNYDRQYWYIREEEFKVINLKSKVRDLAYIDTSGLHHRAISRAQEKKSIMIAVPKAYTDHLIQRRYSKSTYKAYTSYFRQFMDYFNDKEIDNLSHEEINDYLLDLIKNKRMSVSQQNQRINAIKFYYEKVLGREVEKYSLKRPKKEKKLPTILSRDEVNSLLAATINLKHRTILTTIYSGGLRRSELINLKIEDIDSDRGLIKICGSKGKKDRYTILSERLLELLSEYFREYRPRVWLFEGSGGGKYSSTSVEKIFRKAVGKSGIKKYITPHSLRHSFATHLLEQGINLRYIQEILGHEDSRTTEIYTHVASSELSRIRNPLDL